MSKPEDFKFDSRVRDRLLRSRALSTTDVQRHLDQLPDLEGEYEVMNDTPQPAVAPARSEVHDEPLVFDGIRRLQALSEINSQPQARYVAPVSAPISSGGLPSYREPEARSLGTPLRSALMESEISGVGAGAVSAALGAMAAEARSASVFGAPVPIPNAPSSESEPSTPVTLRSEAAPRPVAGTVDEVDEDDDIEDEDEDDDLDEDDDDEDADEDDDVADAAGTDVTSEDDAVGAGAADPDSEDVA